MALTVEQARANCRSSVGKPIVQSCMRSRGKGTDVNECRALATPQVRACMEKALNAANGRANVAVAIPKQKATETEDLAGLPVPYVAPPRTISDIAATLDSERPEARKIDEVKSVADAPTPSTKDRSALAKFYYARGNARAQLGRAEEAIADAQSGIRIGRGAGDPNLLSRLYQLAGTQYASLGNPKQALEIIAQQSQVANQKGARGHLFDAYRRISGLYIAMGDGANAEAYLQRNATMIKQARTSGGPGWRASYAANGQSWEASYDYNRAILFEAKGQFREAEDAYRRAEQRWQGSLAQILRTKNPPPLTNMLTGIDQLVLSQARMKARQGRFAAAEADARRALMSRLKDVGKYHPNTPGFIRGLAGVLSEQGRYREAEQLVRVALEINGQLGVAADSQSTAQVLSQLGAILSLQDKEQEAFAVYAELDTAIAKWPTQRREGFELDGWRIGSLYAAGRIEDALAASKVRLARAVARFGEKHVETAAARGALARGHMKAGQSTEALRQFELAVPVLLAEQSEADSHDTTVVAARRMRQRTVAEAYISLLARTAPGTDVAAATFQLADVVRGQSVQQALAASNARMAVRDEALAKLIRHEQNLSRQINAQLGILNNALALPSDQRDEKALRIWEQSIAKTRADRETARKEIDRRFPAYAELIDPKAPSAKAMQDVLRADEALLSFYFGRNVSFVWAVPKQGPATFALISASAAEIERKVQRLREALEPAADKISDIPPFDLTLAHDLYRLLLEPVETSWKPARNLVVVTNGALGVLPLALLPTSPEVAGAQPGAPPFAEYRQVRWLVRDHTITTVPSVAALKTIRQLPPGPAAREPLIGFGDPVFKPEAETAVSAISSDRIEIASVEGSDLALRRRAVPQTRQINSASLALLPTLPDTADELRSIALSLQIDPSRALNLGRDASEQKVKSIDLSRYRIVAFSTHGLLPGDLDGLTQPALALSAPSAADAEGDGLLTAEEVLALRLDADWVVLSACNTGVGAAAGAEALSGLGQAFLYAGTRTLLVTNWSVHSPSATELVAALFRRQRPESRITRAEALRGAMIEVMDGPGATGKDGRTLYTYAHPLFWAPFSMVGDGGGGERP